ncbi:MAG: nucleotidyltransferase domain-containing protein [candidate division NC10 bacterium]|nr:nucleotidyltransferase domain-containing protein [candidate division NC10 bacterium]
MATIPAAIAQSVERFLSAVRRVRRVEAAYLYGSQVHGDARAWSDIDLAVISPDFQGDLFQERVMLLRLAAEVDDRIEPTPFTPDNFTPANPLAYEISRSGVRVV